MQTASVVQTFPACVLKRKAGHYLPAMLLLLFGAPALTQADVILSSNLSNPSAGTETTTGTAYLGASFGTDSSAYALTSVNLLLSGSASTSAEIDLYSDDGYEPSALIGKLSPSSTLSSNLTSEVFTATGITLDADSTYWVVLKAFDGSVDWSWTTDSSGTGSGYQGQWSQYVDFGSGTSYWASSSDYPLQMSVSASAVPEPSTSMMLLLGGALATAGVVRFRNLPRGEA